MEWRCAELYTLAMIDAGIGCVLRALCSGTACSPARLGLWRDESLFLSGGLGLSMTFSQLQCALNRLRESPDTVDAPAGAIVLRKMGNLTSGWSVLALGVGVYIFGAWLRTLSGKHHSHAVCYNAEARVLYLGGWLRSPSWTAIWPTSTRSWSRSSSSMASTAASTPTRGGFACTPHTRAPASCPFFSPR